MTQQNSHKINTTHTTIKIVGWVLFVIIFSFKVQAQTTYKMVNGKAYDCRGKLTDSETNKANASWYASDENYIFTVSVPGASSIVVTFNGAFDVESNADFLKVFDGKDTNSTLIKKYDNNSKPSGFISSTDSSITFYFHSDKYVNGSGFELSWRAKITKVTQPTITPISDPSCNSTKIRVVLDQMFHCDSIKAKNFKLSGTLTTAVASAVGINCNSKNESNTFDVTFVSGLNQSGNYTLDFNSTFKDRCDSIWQINAKLNFKITDCPIVVILRSNKDSICNGSCATLTATITGGNPSNYVYTWISGGISGKPPKTVCPTTSTRYILQVSDGISVPGRDTVDIFVKTPPKAQNDTTVCESNAAFNLSAQPAGGRWSGTGITNSITGTFDPSVSKSGTFAVTYKNDSCTDIVNVTVKAINAGPPNAACPGSAPFMVSNFSPAGGSWSGPNISSSGIITPPASATSFTVTYSWNGCSSTKVINIDGITTKKSDTVCQSVTTDTLKFSPKGGIWSGPALSNTLLGINSPTSAGAGIHLYIYTINGCKDTLKRNVQGVDARWDEIACPDAGQKTLPAGIPAGGYWTGKGIFDKTNGIFDADTFQVPGKSTFAYSILTYNSPNGCKDDKIMYLRYTRFYADTIKRCSYDTADYLRYAFVYNDPWNMYFTGSSAITGTSLYYQQFNPKLAGSGTFHKIIGDANGCKDTLIIQIFPRARIQKDTSFCVADDPFKLYSGEKNGSFFGKGITNASTGMFSPSIAGVGVHTILFSMPGKCIDTIKITVRALPIVSFSGLKSFYCLKDTLVQITLSPGGGVLTGAGIIDSSFNPKKAGSGNHSILYKFGTGKCINQWTQNITVADTLKLDLFSNKDSICIGTTVTLDTKSSGGIGNYTLNWSSGQGNVKSIFVNTNTSKWFMVVLKDGCSDSAEKKLEVYVHPKMTGTSISSPIQCYGNPGFITLNMQGAGPFTYSWNTIPPQNTASINAPAGSTNKVYVNNTKTGCKFDTSIAIPGHSPIRAYFTYSPNGKCMVSYNAELQIINLSQGGVTGFWDLGDSTIIPYDPNINPTHLYDGLKDKYTVKLVIKNAGGCVDSFSQTVCVKEITDIVLPNSFSPNNDGINDIFRVEYATFLYSSMSIFNRWGEKVFYSEDIKVGWDGTYKGVNCPMDYYVYSFTYKGKKTANMIAKGVLYLIR